MLKEKILTYYDWDDVEEFLSNAMGFDKKYFRNYHEVVGGEYKDFWHVWLQLHHYEIANDSYVVTYLDDLDETGDNLQEKYPWATELLVNAMKKLSDAIDSETITIRYYW